MDRDGSGAITPDEVEDLLTATYGFPPLEEEIQMFMEKFDLNQDGKVTLTEFRTVLGKLREETQEKAKQASEYTSLAQMRDDRFKNRRMQKDVTDKYKLPMTAAQTHGFYVNDEQQKEITKCEKHPIRKCEETKYADEMVRTGFLFS